MTRYTDAVGTLLPTGAGEVLKTLAAERHLTASTFVRQIVMERLEAEIGTKQAEQPERAVA